MKLSRDLTIVTPTIGRLELHKLIKSVEKTKWHKHDEWFVIGDNQRELPDWLPEFVQSLGHPFQYFEYSVPGSGWGNAQRNWAISQAREGNYLVWADDNDVFVPGAIDLIRSYITPDPQPLQFEVTWGGVLRPVDTTIPMDPHAGRWEDAGGGQQFVVPNLPGMTARWPNTGSSDYNFVTDTLRLWGGPEAMIRIPKMIMHTT